MVARDNLQSPVVALYIETLNDLIDIHTKRTVAVLSSRIPGSLWLGIYGVALLTMLLVGLQTSYGERRNWLSILVLVLVFSVVLTLIVDLDRPTQGLLTVNQQAMRGSEGADQGGHAVAGRCPAFQTVNERVPHSPAMAPPPAQRSPAAQPSGSLPLLATKLHRPRLAAPLVQRPRLLHAPDGRLEPGD